MELLQELSDHCNHLQPKPTDDDPKSL